MLERLQKIISAAGVTSRRAAETLITEGRVRVNGKVVTELGSKADPSKDHIKVDGKLINPQQPLTYIMLNKPAGYVTTMSDPEGRPTVQDLLKGVKTRVYPVGRLDYNTEGLLLLTNDGDFAHLITHPSHEFPKTYLAKVKGVLDDSMIEKLEAGIFLADGKTAPAKVRKIRKEEMNSWLEITIHEGRKRQVRRMFDHIGRSVIKLKRVKTGGLSLSDLPEGKFRHLTSEEVRALRETALKTADSGIPVKVFKPAEKVQADVAKERPTASVLSGRRTGPLRDTTAGQRRNQGGAPSRSWGSTEEKRRTGPQRDATTGQRRGQGSASSGARGPRGKTGKAGQGGRKEGFSHRSSGQKRTESEKTDLRKSMLDTRAGGAGVKRRR